MAELVSSGMEIAMLLLRFGPGLMLTVYGADQIRHPEHWRRWIPDEVRKAFPAVFGSRKREFMAWGIVDLVIGLMLMSGTFPLFSAWIAFVWMLLVLPFAFNADWQAGMRDFAITCAILALIMLQS